MSALLFQNPLFRPLSISGAILPNSYVQFYVTNTTTPTDVYADAALGTPLSNPVVADAAGIVILPCGHHRSTRASGNGWSGSTR